MVLKNCPIIGKHVVIIFIALYVTIEKVWFAKNTLKFSFKYLYFRNGKVDFFLIIQFC